MGRPDPTGGPEDTHLGPPGSDARPPGPAPCYRRKCGSRPHPRASRSDNYLAGGSGRGVQGQKDYSGVNTHPSSAPPGPRRVFISVLTLCVLRIFPIEARGDRVGGRRRRRRKGATDVIETPLTSVGLVEGPTPFRRVPTVTADPTTPRHGCSDPGPPRSGRADGPSSEVTWAA